MGTTVGERLRKLRGGTSQAEVAEAVKISQNALSAYENNNRTPRDPVKVRLASYYGVKIQDLFF